MKIPDPVQIGWPRFMSPRVIGEFADHPWEYLQVGQEVTVKTLDGDFRFTAQVSYTPKEGKRNSTRVILTPVGELVSEFWNTEGARKY